MGKKVRISPSIIAVQYNNEDKLKEALDVIRSSRLSLLHLDVMDGKFVPAKHLDSNFVQKMREQTDFILDVHLMVQNPENVIQEYIDAGADILTIHAEATSDTRNTLQKIRSSGVLAGVAIKPDTPVSAIKKLIDEGLVDMVLVMSVEPGACGRPFDQRALEKIRELRTYSSKLDIEVDGGINNDNLPSVVDAGANLVVSGSHIFGAVDPKAVIKSMKGYRTKG